MRFGPWYPLVEAGDHTPAAENVVQVRLAAGLLDYPRGKSAMVWYAHARDARAKALALMGARGGEDLVCRHLIEIDAGADLGTFCAKLREDFVRRFGTLPRYETVAE
ncbi:MAG: hypothetical protein ACKV2T_20965 [Kofleriaceae bacterium]